ncbi:MAG: PAS domain S-box protein [Deltaproteobacteria bacterium]|nr:MAG: PAS domain S-box protein [Deltaproteobacteria bacterium]
MNDQSPTKEQLLEEVAELRRSIKDLQTLEAERSQVERALWESEARYRAIVEDQSELICRFLPDKTFTFVNHAYCRYFDKQREELIGHSFMGLIPQSNHEKLETHLGSLGPDNPVGIHEHSTITTNGESRWLQWTNKAIFDRDGNLLEYQSVGRDISIRKKAEEALKESQVLLNATIESLPFDFFALDASGRYIMQNSTCRQRWGDVIGKRPEDLNVDRENLALWQDNNRRASAGEIVKGEVLLKVGGREEVSYNIISPIRDEGQIRGILGVNIDITDRKRAEEELQEARNQLERRVEQRTTELIRANEQLRNEIEERKQVEQALRESGERFRSIFEESEDAICVMDHEGCYLMVNDAMCRLTGFSREELIGEHYSAFMDKKHYEMMETHWSLVERGEPTPRYYELKLIRRDGDVRIVENVPTMIHLPDRPALTQAVLRDVTERRRMEATLEHMRSKLLNLQESERSWIARVLHDTIGQNISILDFNLSTIEEVLDEASRARIAGLISSMRSTIHETGDKLRNISTGIHPRQVQELGLVPSVTNFIKQFQRRTKLQVITSTNLDELMVEESVAINIFRIIQEAFTNILKHSQCSSVVFAMNVSEARLMVSIKDDGVGFSLEEVRKRDVDQQGMGLFIMQERAKAIGGRLQINSDLNRGTELHLDMLLESGERFPE